MKIILHPSFFILHLLYLTIQLTMQWSLQHLHPTLTFDDIRETISDLSIRLPVEVVARILDESRHWAQCNTSLNKLVSIKAVSYSAAHGHSQWQTGQEGIGAGLIEEDGQVWYLISEAVGCGAHHGTGMVNVSGSGGQVGNESDEQEGDEQGCWVREIVIETVSKDQGWSSAPSQFHGEFFTFVIGSNSYIKELSTLLTLGLKFRFSKTESR
jgi:hypothetical protein